MAGHNRTGLRGPRLTSSLTEKDIARLDRGARFPALRAACREVNARSKAAPDDPVLRDLARILNALDITAMTGDGAALRLLSAVLDKEELAYRAWTIGPPSVDTRRLPARGGRGADGPRRIRSLLELGTSTLLWPPDERTATTIATALTAAIANLFPELAAPVDVDELVGVARELLDEIGVSNREARARSRSETLVQSALVACGMDRETARERIRRAIRD